MKIPKKINVLGYDYKIVTDNAYCLDNNVWGTFLSEQRTIIICGKGLTLKGVKADDGLVFLTLMHELVHAVKHHLGIEDDSERLTEAEALAWAKIFKQLKTGL